MAICESLNENKFLGASITGMTSQLGWGSNGSTHSISLVEDTCNGDNFNPPPLGSPVCVTLSTAVADFESSEGNTDIQTGHGVIVRKNYNNGGDIGGVYLYVGANGSLDLSNQNYWNQNYWQRLYNWNLGGILDSWEFRSSTSSGSTYDAKIGDPTQILDSVQCILANYDGGVFGVPNLINVFGYLENYLGGPCVDFMNGDKSGVNYVPAFGWGGSHINAGGIPFPLVLQALQNILNGQGGVTFGTLPYYRYNSYYVDLSLLATLPVYDYGYRIEGDNKSLTDIIDQVCKDSGFDFYASLGPHFNGSLWYDEDDDGNAEVNEVYAHMSDCPSQVIKIYPVRINRAYGGFVGAYNIDTAGGNIDVGDIAQVAGSGTEYETKNIGLEHRKETLNAFTVGDNFQGIHTVEQVATCSPVDATIWPYWGDSWLLNPDGTHQPILGYGCNNGHCFQADSREWNVDCVGAFYYLCVAEIRAALISKDAWLSWLYINKRALADCLCLTPDIFLNLVRGIGGDAVPKEVFDLTQALIDCEESRKKPGEKPEICKVNTAQENQDNLFSAIKGMADEFYGKKFMVAIPFVCKYVEDETGEIINNWEKTESGWSESPSIIGLLNGSPGLLVFKNERGKLGAFVRYNNAEKLDLTGLTKGDYYFESGYVWIKCTVEKLVQTGGKFWAVISLKTRVWLGKLATEADAPDGFFLDLIRDDLEAAGGADAPPEDPDNPPQAPQDKPAGGGATPGGGYDRVNPASPGDMSDSGNPEDYPAETTEKAQEPVEKINDKVGSKKLKEPRGPVAVLPNAAAIPLKSNKVSYGPWYGGYMGGKTDYDRNTTFSPWNFGSAARMQTAGRIHTIHKVTDVEISEKGSLTAPGYPKARLGDRATMITGAVFGNGPIITDLDIKHDVSSGVKTTYQFQTFTPKFGQLSKKIIDGMQRRGQAVHKLNHKILQRLLEPPPPESDIFRRRDAKLMEFIIAARDRDKDASAHGFVMFDSLPAEAEDEFRLKHNLSDAGEVVEVVRQDGYTGVFKTDFIPEGLKNDAWKRKFGVELSGLFRPFSTDPDSDSHHGSKYEDIQIGGDSDIGQLYNKSGSLGEIYGLDEEDTLGRRYNKSFSMSPMPPMENEYNMPITVMTLNPFKRAGSEGIHGFSGMNNSEGTSHDIDFVMRGDAYPTQMSLYTSLNDPEPVTNYRAISLRGPLVITGWGYDLDGKPVPAHEDNEKKFDDDWLLKPQNWKTGPVDLRWDKTRGLWVAPPSFKLINAKTCRTVGPGHSTDAPDESATWIELLEDEEIPNADHGHQGATDKDGALVSGESAECECDSAGGADGTPSDVSMQVLAYNRTGKVITADTTVLAYFDTRCLRYYIIAAPDPIVIVTMDEIMEAGEVDAIATIDSPLAPDAPVGVDCGSSTIPVKITNTLHQPICKDARAFVYLTDYDLAEGDLFGEVMQAEFAPLTVVSSVDCYEDSGTGEPTLEICDRRIYLQTAWTIEDCGDDDPKKRYDTAGWNPDTDEDNRKPKTPTEGDLCVSDDWEHPDFAGDGAP